MKTINFTIFFFLLVFNISAQKEGNVWCFGNNAGIDFNVTPPVIFNSFTNCFEAATCISDRNGNHIFHISQTPIPNSSSFDFYHAHLINNNFDNLKGSDSLFIFASATQGALILPLPGNSNLYYLFHIGNFSDENYPLCGSNKILRYYYSIIDLSKDNGLGEVVSKNNILINDWATEKMIAVQHGNGRDWWVIMHGINDIFYKLLFSNNGIDTIQSQNIGPSLDEFYSNNCLIDDIGQMSIDLKGNRIAMVSRSMTKSTINIFDFNRCTGEISNYEKIHEDYTEKYYGCEFSPNSNLLYVTDLAFGKLQQFDLSSNNIYLSKKVIANTYISPYFNQLKLFSGKIHITIINSPTSMNYISLINNPNGIDSLCDLEIQAIYLNGAKSSHGLPNIPNFNLGSLLGSACDTLSIVQPEDSPEELLTGINDLENGNGGVRVYPNPASDMLFVEIIGNEFLNAEFKLYNALGQEVLSQINKENTKNMTINLSNVKAGFYNYKFIIDNKAISSDKLIILK